MASFTNRGTKKKPSWQYTISHKPKPIRKGGFRSKTEAQIAAAELEAELRKGFTPHLRPEPFADYFESWLKIYKPDIRGNTLARYKNSLKTVRNYFEGKTIQDINKRSYQAFLNEYADNHAQASTRKINTHIRACVREAIDEGIIRVDFTRGAIISGNKKAKRPEEKHLNFIDSQILIKHLHKKLDEYLVNYLLLLGLTSGLRFAELVGLTRSDFNFDTNEISVTKTWGYTNKMHNGFGPTKNDQSVRTIKIDDLTMNAFQKLFKKTPENIYRLIFFSSRSKYHCISGNGANKALKNLLEKLEIKQPITVHGLRHTHASILLYKGASIYYVSERLGHKDIETTNNHYAHIIKELRERDEKITVKAFKEMAS